MKKIELKTAIDAIVDSEMTTICKLKKRDLLGLCRDLLEERCLEMSDDALIDFYNEVTNEIAV
jgi:hypothetical protein